LSVYNRQKDAGLIGANLDSCYAGPWDVSGGADSSGGRPESRDAGPEVCWISQPDTVPLGLSDMDDHERQVCSTYRLRGVRANKFTQLFSTSVNSPLKMNNPKEGSSTVTGRKTSLSQVNTSGASRPGTRRRETSDSFANGPLSPVENKTFRSDPVTNTPPPALLRRRTDYQDDPQEKDETQPARMHDSPFASLRRSGTGGPPSAGLNPPSASPWPSGPSSTFGSMGAFGSMVADGGAAEPGPGQRPGFGSARSTSRFKDILGKANEDMSPSVKEKASFTGLEQLPEEDDPSAKIRETLKTRPNRSETNPYDDLMPRSGSAALSAHDDSGVEQMGFSAVSNQTPHHRFNQDPTSPTNTNPYQSPYGGRMPDDEGPDPQPGMQSFGRRDVFSGADHRAQNSFGSLRGASSGMAGLGGLPGWDNPSFSAATPGRDRPPVSAAFGDSVFSPLGGLQSPSAFSGSTFFGAGSSFGRGTSQTRLGLPFPPAMQEQMRSESRNDAFGVRSGPFEPRRQDSFRAFDDAKLPGEDAFGLPPNRSPVGVARQSSSNSPTGSNTGSASQIPTTQQRQMVMPDRMRWVYRDPLGNVQGPWSGLEMHDWFKAGFFTAELQVKKQEDTEYEPLAQLVRRIGNSREPFLVPQIGVPHGPPPPANAASPWSPAGPPSSAQPPFASSFPSFGTTLTADQQNALERRKQEEQFLMAQQKEWLAQKQVGMRAPNAPYGSHMHSLQHHSSAQSLHSQPSFGSITSPTGYQPAAPMPPIQPPPSQGSAFQSMTPTAAMPPREDDLSGQFGRMGLNNRSPYGSNPLNQQSFAAHERNRLSMENQQAQQYAHEQTFLGQPGRNDRLEEFHELRQDMDEDELEEEEPLPQPIGSQRPIEDVSATQQPAPIGPSKKIAEDEPLSLTQQVQRTAAANKQAAVEKALVEPPPVSTTPLPAPAAQRSRPPVAEQLAAESRSAAQTPVETPGASLAPWADKTAEMSKGPSLKEIQEMEAKNAAKQEAIHLEARRLQMEQERLAAAQAPAPAPGLPLSSTWASSGSPSTPTTPGGSVWAKPVTAKPTTSAAKKTLAQIQKEEEARKQRADAQAAANARAASYTSAVPTGSRYAQMASKVTAPQQSGPIPVHAQSQSAAGGAWQTVGASGKPKTPATVVAAAPAQRTVSSTTAARPALLSSTSRSASMAASAGPKDKAKEELNKWAKAQLSGKLNSGTNVDNFVGMIVDFPTDIELLAEAVYGSSETLDGRRFAEEFIRRRRLADKGIVEDNKAVPASENKSGNGGWSEVAKKGPATAPKEDATAAGFKVVSKKPKKR